MYDQLMSFLSVNSLMDMKDNYYCLDMWMCYEIQGLELCWCDV